MKNGGAAAEKMMLLDADTCDRTAPLASVAVQFVR